MTLFATEKYFGTKILNCYTIVVLLILSGFTLRMYDLGVPSFWLDEAISSIAAIAILDTGSPTLQSGVVYSRAILSTTLIALSFAIFGITEFAARLPSVFFGTLMIPLVYLIGSRWGNSRIAIIAAVLITFSVWEIAWSRQARMYQQLQFFYLLSLYLFYEFTVHKNLKCGALLTLSVAGTVLSHVFGYVLLLVFAAYLAIHTLVERKGLDGMRSRTVALSALACAVLLGFAYHQGIISAVLSAEINYYDMYIYLLKEDLGIFLFIAVPGGTVLMGRDWKKGLLLIAAIIIPLYFIFYQTLLFGTRYLYFVIPILFILIGYFLDFAIEYLSGVFTRGTTPHKHGDRGGYSDLSEHFRVNSLNRSISIKTITNTVAVLLLLSMLQISPAFTFTPKERYDLGVNAPQPDFRSAYMYVKEDMRPSDAIVSAWTPPTLFYLGKSDYWLVFNVVGTGADKFLVENSSRDVYTNATAITDVEAFGKVVEEYDRGWLVVDATAWHKLKPGMWDFISGNLTCYVRAYDHDMVEVYGWGHENETGANGHEDTGRL